MVITNYILLKFNSKLIRTCYTEIKQPLSYKNLPVNIYLLNTRRLAEWVNTNEDIGAVYILKNDELIFLCFSHISRSIFPQLF